MSIANLVYVEAQLKELGIKRLTNIEKEALKKQNIIYQRQYIEVSKKISELNKKISELENTLKEAIPTAPGTTYIHQGYSGCGLRAVVQIGVDEASPVYYCLMCDTDFQSDIIWNHIDKDF
ncbi:MAG: hypothetical protein ABIH65_00155 [Nanoarchaeota archaeon]